MTIKVWEIDGDDESYDALSPEQREFVDFVWKMDYEGGVDGLLGHSGTLYFPEALKPLAARLDALNAELHQAMNALGKELDIQW